MVPIPRGNGQEHLAAAVGLWALFEGPEGAEVPIVAGVSERQAAETLRRLLDNGIMAEQKPLTETVQELHDQGERETKAKIAAQPPHLTPTVDPNEVRAIGSRLAVEVEALWDALTTMAVEIDALRRRLGE